MGGLSLTKECDIGFEHSTPNIDHIRCRIVEAAGVSDANPKTTPAPREALGRDLEGAPFDDLFNYASVVGMMLYLSNNSRPDIAFAVSQCARYTHHPTALHSNYLKHIAKYLKGTCDKGLILNPRGNPPPSTVTSTQILLDFGTSKMKVILIVSEADPDG